MPPTIGIIGDGFGAAALVLHLSQHAPEYLDYIWDGNAWEWYGLCMYHA